MMTSSQRVISYDSFGLTSSSMDNQVLRPVFSEVLPTETKPEVMLFEQEVMS